MDPSSGSQAPGAPPTLSPEAIAFAGRMYDSARKGEVAVFEQALPAGLPPNMTNEKGDTLVRQPPKRRCLVGLQSCGLDMS